MMSGFDMWGLNWYLSGQPPPRSSVRKGSQFQNGKVCEEIIFPALDLRLEVLLHI